MDVSPAETPTSLTTRQGELGNKKLDIRITDKSTGSIVVDEQATTFDNGFVGLWVPSDIKGTIEIDGRTGSTNFSTADDGATCVTDPQLA